MAEVRYTSITQFVMGTRWDRLPPTRPQPLFTYICAFCKATTYTEKGFSESATVICNICSATMNTVAATDPSTAIVWDIPPDLLNRLVSQAHQKGVPPQLFIIGFLEWKTDRELSEIRLFNREDRQIYIIKKT